MPPKFSIIIPVYNVAPYLRECLDSVLAQTYTDWEAICVDDGSTDGSGAILDEYAARDSRFHVIHQENAGVANARQVGLEAARGEYIVWVDSDDYIERTHLWDFAEAVKESQADFVWSDFVEDRGGGLIEKVVQESALCCDDFLTRLLRGRLWGALWARAFRRVKVLNSGSNFSDGQCVIMEDIYFLTNFLLSKPSIAKARGATYKYKIRQGSLSNQGCSSEWWANARTAVEAIYQNLKSRCNRSDALYRVAKFKLMMLFEDNVSDMDFFSFHPEIKWPTRDLASLKTSVLFFLASIGARGLIRRMRRIKNG